MPKSQDRPRAITPQLPRALLLCGKNPSPEDRNLKGVLNFLGIPWKAVTVGEITGALPANVARNEFCILSSAPCMAQVLQGIEDSHGALPRSIMEASSVYVYGFQDTDLCRRLLRLLTSEQRNLRKLNTTQAFMSITSDCPDMCGPMSGIGVPVDLTDDLVFGIAHEGEESQSLIKANDSDVFSRVIHRGVHFYINVCPRIVDISSPSAKYFDVKKLFCEAVPIMIYLKWAFRGVCWASPETSACLIVDDPVLKPRYGFLHFREVLELMDKYNFTTTIAFIPWNWQRTDPRTVAMFYQRPDRFSLSVHGCNHTANEFAARSTALLNSRIKAATQRMECFLQETSVQYGRVMVFPQGAFSLEAACALKLNGFVAAVNTEVKPASNARNQTTIADLWNVAMMKYGTFPVFTRRALKHGIENFAFDALLGKPCLIGAHHDVFKHHGSDLVDFIATLNSLNWNLRWRPLGDAISHSFTVRNHAGGTNVIQLFAKNLVIENPSTEPREVVLMTEESDPDCVKAVTVNQTSIDFSYEGGYLQFRMTLYPQERAAVRIIYFDNLDVVPSADGIVYSIKAGVRRYFAELRDNYFSKSDILYEGTLRIRRVLKGTGT